MQDFPRNVTPDLTRMITHFRYDALSDGQMVAALPAEEDGLSGEIDAVSSAHGDDGNVGRIFVGLASKQGAMDRSEGGQMGLLSVR